MSTQSKSKEELIKELQKLIDASQEFIQFSHQTPDYNKILQTVLDLSGAKYAAFNIFEDNGLDFKTVALAGISENIKKAMSLLGFDVINKPWKYDRQRDEKTALQNISRFDHLHDFVDNVISKRAIYLIEKTFDLGETFVVKIIKLDKILGDFTLIYNSGETLTSNKLVDLYAHQVGLFLDRNKTTNELRISEEKHRLLIENSQDIIATITQEGVFTFVSPSWTVLLGHPVKEVVGKTLAEFIHPKDINKCLLLLELVFKYGKQKNGIEYRVRHLDGSWRWHYANGSPVSNADGTVVCFQAIASDITERKKSEETINLLANATKCISECISITDMNDTLIFVNSAFLETYRYEEHELLGNKISMVRSLNNPPEVVEKILPATLLGGWKGELINHRKDGSEFPVYISTSVVRNENNNPIALIGVANDISQRKKTEEELLSAKDRAEESDRLKSAFLANMSHEIRTPMNGILGFAELLKEPDLTGEEQQEYITIIEDSGRRMLNILNDIIDLSKIEAGQTKVELAESDINAQIEYVYTFFKPEVEAKGLQFFFRNSLPSKESVIKTDREKLYAVIINLVKNAIKYTHEGSIEFGYNLEASDASGASGVSNEEKVLEFFVKDTGIGIPKDKHEAIFDRFVQAETSYKRNFQGAGLGLSISKAYIQMLGGNIWVESESGKGSVFYFTIPYKTESGEKNTDSSYTDVIKDVGEDNHIRPLNILIAEDDETSAFLLEIMVKMYGKNIIKARTGIEAIAACRENPDIDLIMMDVQMPEMDGYEAVKQIRKFYKDVIIIAETAFGLSGDREKAIEAGCDDYISKPINSFLLKKLINKYFCK